METNLFDDIRPYNDSELREAIGRISQWSLIPQILRFIYPEVPVEDSMKQLRSVQTVKDLQTTFMYDAICRIIKTTSQGFTCSGFDYIRRDRPCLYISNHRDITLDAFLLQKELIDRQRDTSYIVFGNNLMLWTPKSNTFIDPETSTFGNDLEGNYGEFSANPSSRKFGFNVQVKF